DPPILTIRREFKRPRRDLITKLEGAQTGHIVDALQGRGALDYHVKPVDTERASFVGPALTCECGANDNLAIMAALVVAQPGDVIIAACDGFAATAGVGDILAMMAKNKGVAAVVTDGMARDREGIVAAGLPVFARGIPPNSFVRSGPGIPGTSPGMTAATVGAPGCRGCMLPCHGCTLRAQWRSLQRGSLSGARAPGSARRAVAGHFRSPLGPGAGAQRLGLESRVQGRS